MHWLDGLYRLVYSTAMREITRSISYSEMERLGIERIIILECGVYDCTPIYTSRQNTQLSWLLSPAALPTGHWLRLPKLLKSGSSTSSNSSTLLLQQSSNAAFSSDSIRLSHFCPLALIEPFCWHQTKVYLGRVKFAELFTFCQKEQSTNNSQFWRNINPSLPNVSRPLTPMTVRVARARARRSQLVKQIGTQPARDCQTES